MGKNLVRQKNSLGTCILFDVRFSKILNRRIVVVFPTYFMISVTDANLPTHIYSASIIGDPGAVGRVGRKDATKDFKYGRKSPWVPTLTELFPKIQAEAPDWVQKMFYTIVANRQTVSPEFFS